MARARLVRRTVEEIVWKVLGINLDTNEVETIEVSFPKQMTDKARKAYLSTNYPKFAPAKVISETTKETLYGMPEELFLKYAKPLDGYNGKFEDDDEDEPEPEEPATV